MNIYMCVYIILKILILREDKAIVKFHITLTDCVIFGGLFYQSPGLLILLKCLGRILGVPGMCYWNVKHRAITLQNSESSKHWHDMEYKPSPSRVQGSMRRKGRLSWALGNPNRQVGNGALPHKILSGERWGPAAMSAILIPQEAVHLSAQSEDLQDTVEAEGGKMGKSGGWGWSVDFGGQDYIIWIWSFFF